MDQIEIDLGNGIRLTEDHPASCYGLPVVVIQARAFQPGDEISEGMTARDLVRQWLTSADRTEEERIVCQMFLRVM